MSGPALVRAVIDTLGNVEPQTVEVLESPDTALHEALKAMMRGSRFTPGRIEGRAVRTFANLALNVSPPRRLPPLELINRARDRLARQPDTALVLLDEALDSAAHPSGGERIYALLLRGKALHRLGHDSAAGLSFEAGLAAYREVTSAGIDLAPFLRRLADSIRLASRRGSTARSAASPMGRPLTATSVDQQPVLLSHPPIRYPREMQALRVGGTVILEAVLDTMGRVDKASLRIVQSPNPGLNAEATRVVLAAVYRPARARGRPLRVTIRQPITFAPY